MAVVSHTVNINFKTQGGKVVTKDLDAMTKSSKAAASATQFFNRALGLLAVTFGARALAQYSDTVTNLHNRLKLVTQSSGDLFLITEDLFDVALKTRASFDSTAQVYTRLALSARQLGLSHQQLLDITEALNSAVLLSGTTSREAANGLIQLSQAIASNRLGGDELRSVLEQLPLVADIIGKELVKLGIATRGTRGEIRQLGFEGKITSKIITDASLHALPDLRKSMLETTPTISQAFENLQTQVIRTVNDFNEFTASGATVARVLLFIGDHLDTILKVLGPLAIAFGIVKTATISWGLALSALSFLLTPTGLIVGGIAIVSAGVLALANHFGLLRRDVTRFNEDSLKELGDAMKDAGTLTGEQRDKIYELNQELRAAIALTERIKASPLSFSNDDAINAAKNVVKIKKSIIEAIRPPAETDASKEAKDQAALFAKIKRQLNGEYAGLKLTNREREIQNDLLRYEEQLRAKKVAGDDLKNKLAELEVLVRRNKAQEEYTKELDALRQPLQDFTIANEKLQEIMEKEPALADAARVAQRQKTIEYLQTLRTAKAGLERAGLEQKQEFEDAATFAAKAYRDITDPAMEYEATMKGINAVVEKYPHLQDEANRAAVEARITFLQTQTDMASGFERGFLGIRQEVTDLASLAETTLTNAFQNAENALVDFFTTGKLNMTQFVNSLQADIARLALRGLLTNALSGAIGIGGQGSGGFNIGQAIGNFFGGKAPEAPAAPASTDPSKNFFAKGGSFMVGGMGGTDSQTVAFRASPNERVTVETPEQARAGRSGRQTVVNMTIVTPDSQSFQRSQGQIAARQQRLLQKAGSRNN